MHHSTGALFGDEERPLTATTLFDEVTLVRVGGVVRAANRRRQRWAGVRTLAAHLVAFVSHASPIGAVVSLAKYVLDGQTPLEWLVLGDGVNPFQVVQVQTQYVAVLDRVLPVADLVEQKDPGIVRLDEVRTRRCVAAVETAYYDVRAHQLLVALKNPDDAHQSLVVGFSAPDCRLWWLSGLSHDGNGLVGRLRRLAGQVNFPHAASNHQIGQILGFPGQVFPAQFGFAQLIRFEPND